MSGFSVFLTIAAIGFLFLLVSLFFGEIFGHFGDVHFEHGGPGFFSVLIMSVFITAFGGFGAVATESGLSTLPASGVGLASGKFFAFLIYAFARFLYGQQAPTDVRTSDLVGRSARVVVAIPTGDVGQVAVGSERNWWTKLRGGLRRVSTTKRLRIPRANLEVGRSTFHRATTRAK